MIFWITPDINADHMEARDGRVCKVARIATTLNTGRAPLSDNLNNGRIMSGSINNM
jgi:hypothetical protein